MIAATGSEQKSSYQNLRFFLPSAALLLAVLELLSLSRPLWTDEVLQLAGTNNLSGRALLEFIKNMPGQAPLGYLIQHWTLQGLGFSSATARLPSVLCGVAAVFAVGALSKQVVPGSTLAVATIWLGLPLVARYATEARPYSMALLFAALSTLFFHRLLTAPTIGNCVPYFLCVLAGLYSVPFTLFLQIGIWRISSMHANACLTRLV